MKKYLSTSLFVLLSVVICYQAYFVYAYDLWCTPGCDSFDCVYVYYGSAIVYHQSCYNNEICNSCNWLFFPSNGHYVCSNSGRAPYGTGQAYKPCQGVTLAGYLIKYGFNSGNCVLYFNEYGSWPYSCVPPGPNELYCG